MIPGFAIDFGVAGLNPESPGRLDFAGVGAELVVGAEQELVFELGVTFGAYSFTIESIFE